MSWGAEGIPRDVEPAGGGQELVGVRAGAKKVDKTLELGWGPGGGCRQPGQGDAESCERHRPGR